MVPPPKPVAAREETEVWETAYGPRRASMLDWLGAGPRSYGLAAVPAAPALGVRSRVRQAAAVAAAAMCRFTTESSSRVV